MRVQWTHAHGLPTEPEAEESTTEDSTTEKSLDQPASDTDTESYPTPTRTKPPKFITQTSSLQVNLKPITFHSFPRLPIEIRTIIWNYAVAVPIARRVATVEISGCDIAPPPPSQGGRMTRLQAQLQAQEKRRGAQNGAEKRYVEEKIRTSTWTFHVLCSVDHEARAAWCAGSDDALNIKALEPEPELQPPIPSTVTNKKTKAPSSMSLRPRPIPRIEHAVEMEMQECAKNGLTKFKLLRPKHGFLIPAQYNPEVDVLFISLSPSPSSRPTCIVEAMSRWLSHDLIPEIRNLAMYQSSFIYLAQVLEQAWQYGLRIPNLSFRDFRGLEEIFVVVDPPDSAPDLESDCERSEEVEKEEGSEVSNRELEGMIEQMADLMARVGRKVPEFRVRRWRLVRGQGEILKALDGGSTYGFRTVKAEQAEQSEQSP